MKSFVVRLDDKQHKKLKKLSQKHEISMAEFIRRTLQFFLKRGGKHAL